MTHAGPVLFRVSKVALIGALNTGLDLACFLLLTYAAGLAVGFANIVSYGVGTACSYTLNRNWAFRDRAAAGATGLVLFVGTNVAGLALGTATIVALTGLVPAWVAKGLSVPVTFGFNYACYNWIVFTGRRGRCAGLGAPGGSHPRAPSA